MNKSSHPKNMREKKGESQIEKKTIMIVDDEAGMRESLTNLLSEEYNVITASSGEEALDIILKMDNPEVISLIISDQRMSGLTGIQLFEKLKDKIPSTIRIILTAYSDFPVIMSAINKAKVYEILLKPFEPEDLKLRIKRAVEAFTLQNELEEYRTAELRNTQEQLVQLKESLIYETPLRNPYHFREIITQNKTMQNIFRYIEEISEFNVPVLITGETGTGKELIAKVIHNIYQETNKLNGEFVADNVAGWDEELFNDNLFGHKKGAFSSAFSDRNGQIEQAVNGTVFLDEIGDLPLNVQTKLLRLIQEKTFFPIGVDKLKTTNARFIFATNRNINAMKDEGKFRTDLFYRLNTHQIYLPPLRERKDDIPRLVDYFISEAMEEYKKKEKPVVTGQLIALLTNYHFPGNIRELRGMVFAAVSIFKTGILSLDVFIRKIEEQGGKVDISALKTEEETDIMIIGKFPKINQMKRIYALKALECEGSQSKAAELCGIDRKTLAEYLSNS